jgi:hypothetical protein
MQEPTARVVSWDLRPHTRYIGSSEGDSSAVCSEEDGQHARIDSYDALRAGYGVGDAKQSSFTLGVGSPTSASGMASFLATSPSSDGGTSRATAQRDRIMKQRQDSDYWCDKFEKAFERHGSAAGHVLRNSEIGAFSVMEEGEWDDASLDRDACSEIYSAVTSACASPDGSAVWDNRVYGEPWLQAKIEEMIKKGSQRAKEAAASRTTSQRIKEEPVTHPVEEDSIAAEEDKEEGEEESNGEKQKARGLESDDFSQSAAAIKDEHDRIDFLQSLPAPPECVANLKGEESRTAEERDVVAPVHHSVIIPPTLAQEQEDASERILPAQEVKPQPEPATVVDEGHHKEPEVTVEPIVPELECAPASQSEVLSPGAGSHSATECTSSVYTYAQLKGLAYQYILPAVEASSREQLLTSLEFESVFGMTKEKFMLLPKWRQTSQKKALDLF